MLLFVSFLVLALPQAVLARFKFSLSAVEQCGPVNITFSGDDPSADAIPITFTILPFNSTPISIPIPNAMTNSSGVYVTFLPLTEGTTFIASLDDAAADNTGKVTDVIKVLPSPTGNTTCLPAAVANTDRFIFDDSVSQCELFNVTYDPTIVPRPPSIRSFVPLGGSDRVNLTSRPSEGTASYTMTAKHGTQIVLLFDDGQNHRQTSPLLTVGGDSTSSSQCLQNNDTTPDGQSASSVVGSHVALSSTAIIGIAVGAGGLVLLVSILMAVYIIRERRRRRQGVPIDDEAGIHRNLQADTSPQEKSYAENFSEGFVRNPPYTARGFSFARDSTFSSWEHVIPNDQRRSVEEGARSPPSSFNYKETAASIKRPSMTSIDIERILDMATLYQDRTSADLSTRRRSSVVLPNGRPMSPTESISQKLDLGVSRNESLTVPPPATLRRTPTRTGHSHDPSDVPLSLSMSMLFPNVPDPTKPLRIDTGIAMAYDSEEHARLSYTSQTAILSPQMQESPVGLPANPRSQPTLPRLSRDRVIDRSGGQEGATPSRPQRRDTLESL